MFLPLEKTYAPVEIHIDIHDGTGNEFLFIKLKPG